MKILYSPEAVNDLISLGLIPRCLQRKTVGWVERSKTHQHGTV